MSSILAPLFRIEERALSIGLRLKRSSQGEIGLPQPNRFAKSLRGGEGIPLSPFHAGEIHRAQPLHNLTVTDLRALDGTRRNASTRRHRDTEKTTGVLLSVSLSQDVSYSLEGRAY